MSDGKEVRTLSGRKFRTEWLVVGSLRTHPIVQRQFKEKWARQLAENFDPDKVGAILVSRTKVKQKVLDFVFDGQHRVWAAAEALGKDQRVPCHVYEGLDDETCAAVSVAVNRDRSPWTTIDIFRNRVIAGDKVADEITKIVSAASLKISPQFMPGHLRAVVAAERVYTRFGAEVLLETLKILHSAWGHMSESLDQTLINGMGMFLSEYGDQIDRARFVKRLGSYANPVRLLGDARQLVKISHKNKNKAVFTILVEEYNKGLRSASRLAE